MSCTLSDVITYVPLEQANGDSQPPQDYLNQLLNLISRLRGGASRYVPMLMSKVQDNLPHMSNPLPHMPNNLEGFMESSPSSSSSSGEMIRPIHITRSPLTQIQIPSSMSQYGTPSSQTGFSEQVMTPQSQTMHHQDRLMFEAYSPSVNSHTDAGMTPPMFGLPGTPQQQYAMPGMSGHLPQPRSMPIGSASNKQEGWDGYHG